MRLVRTFFCVALLHALWFGALDSASAAAAFPVKYVADGRTLVDQNGVPFPILGRTAWFITSLTASNRQTFLDDTASRGFNAIEFHVLNHDPRGNIPPFNGNGNLPFLKQLNGAPWTGSFSYASITSEAPDFTTPNPAYWSEVDTLLATCEAKGLLVFMFPAYVGYNGGEQGWMREMVANGPTKVQSYGAWLATRYKNQKNVVWMMGGDMGTPPHAFNSAQTSAESGLLNGLKGVPGQQSLLFSAEWDSGSIATDQTSFGSSMTLNGVYSWTGDVNTHGRRAYAHSPIQPAFLLEEPYDEEGPDGNGYNPSATQPVRRYVWWGWLSTIGGYIAGNGYVWPFRSGGDADWRNHLDTPGARDLARLNAFIGANPWNKLVPSGLNGMRTLVLAGGGASASAPDYVAAAATANGRYLVAYLPPAHSGPVSLDLAAMSGLTRARWFDPTSGAYSLIGAGLTNSGSYPFTPSIQNSAGGNDWVLVLDVPDNTKPALKITGPTSAATFTNTTGTIQLAGTASDNIAVTQVTWSNNRGGSGVASGTNAWSVPTITLSPGLNQLIVTATDPAGNSTQAVLAVTYLVPPFFLSQPASVFAATNDTVIFQVSVGGDEPMKFQWRKNGGNIVGATNDLLLLTNVSPAAAGNFAVFVSNVAGSRTSTNAALTVFVPPAFTSQPGSRSVTQSNAVSFSASAAGTAPIYFQWHFAGQPISGATNANYSIARALTSQAGFYSVTASNYAGVRVSTNAELKVNVPPFFLVQPTTQFAVLGPTNLTFAAAAGGTEPLRFQWRMNGGNISGATNASYTLTNIIVSSGGNLSVSVANVAGTIVSSNALLKVFLKPVFTSQPVNRSVTLSNAVGFSASASGTPPLFYQWNLAGTPISGATNSSYNIARAQTNQAGLYSITVSNFAGALTSSNAALTVNVPPRFLIQPVSQPAVVGPTNLTFLADATGTAPLRFQWRKDGGNLAGATNASYVLTNITTAAGGNYSVVVANVAATVISSNALLKVFLPPVFTSQPASRSLTAGGATSFSAGVSGTPPLSFQWWHDEEPLLGATNASYFIASAQTNHAGTYRVTAANFAGMRSSSNAVLTVNVPPGFVLQPVSQAVPVGGATAFNVAVSGTAPFRFQWRKNGGNLVGATNATFTILNVTNSNAGGYSVFVQNLAGSITSSNATLSVLPALAAGSAVESTPGLGFAAGGDFIVLTWPANAANYQLQSSADLQDWQPEPAPEIQGDTCVVTNRPAGSVRFFRLIR